MIRLEHDVFPYIGSRLINELTPPERFHKTILNEFYQVTFLKKLYATIEALQKDLDEWLVPYNTERTHQGKMSVAGLQWKLLRME